MSKKKLIFLIKTETIFYFDINQNVYLKYILSVLVHCLRPNNEFFLVITADSLRLVAYISSGGLHGEIRFEQATEYTIRIQYSLKPTLQYPDQQWLWSVTQFPVDYTIINDRCDEQYIGER